MLEQIFRSEAYGSALILCMTNLLFTFLQKRTDKMQNKFYILMNIVISINAASAIVSIQITDLKRISDAAFMVERLAQFSYFLLHLFLGPMFAFYVLYASGMERKTGKLGQLVWGTPIFVAEAMLLSNPFTGWMYTFDQNRDFQRNWGEYLVYVCCIVYFAFGFVTLVFSWKSLTSKKRYAMLYFFILTAVGVLIQMLFIELTLELFFESLGMLGVMIAIETEDDRIDNDTGFYNRRALLTDISAYLTNRKRFAVICIKITNAEIIQRATGTQNSDILPLLLSDYLKSLVPRYHIYNATSEAFMLTMMGQNEEEIKPLAQEISARFEKPFSCQGTDILLSAVILTADVPSRMHSAADVIAMADQPVPKKNLSKVLYGENLDYLLRRVAVEEAVTRGLKENCFEVYYQPTYHIDGRLHGAEALIRLHDTVIGSVFPDEFIPVAEQKGMIDLLDNFVFAEVCKFLKSGIPDERGMDMINVNLSVMHCMQPGFVAQINQIADTIGIDKSKINFEITESVAATDYDVLSNIVTDLKREGYHFSMDDYGTGYSNMESIFSLDFDVVKIDKSILWSAEKGGIGQIVLENTVRMVQQMHRKILVEGVETQAQIDMLRKLKVDYLQGFFFSRPVPLDRFMEIIGCDPSDLARVIPPKPKEEPEAEVKTEPTETTSPE